MVWHMGSYFKIFVLDVNECEIGNGGCEHTCENQPGSFVCRCPEGLQLASNGKTCIGKSKLRKWFLGAFPSDWIKELR